MASRIGFYGSSSGGSGRRGSSASTPLSDRSNHGSLNNSENTQMMSTLNSLAQAVSDMQKHFQTQVCSLSTAVEKIGQKVDDLKKEKSAQKSRSRRLPTILSVS